MVCSVHYLYTTDVQYNQHPRSGNTLVLCVKINNSVRIFNISGSSYLKCNCNNKILALSNISNKRIGYVFRLKRN